MDYVPKLFGLLAPEQIGHCLISLKMSSDLNVDDELEKLLLKYPYESIYKALGREIPFEAIVSPHKGAWADLIRFSISDDAPNPNDVSRAISSVQGMIEAAYERQITRGAPVAELQVANDTSWLIATVMMIVMRHALKDVSSDNSLAAWGFVIQAVVTERMYVVLPAFVPFLSRYFSIIAIVLRKRSDLTRCITSLVSMCKPKYDCALNNFVSSVMVVNDVATAKNEIKAIAEGLKSDPFVSANVQRVVESTKLVIFDYYTRVHESWSMNTIDDLNGGQEESERWIVEMLKSKKLTAKIDTEKKVVHRTKAVPNVYGSLVERNIHLIGRTNSIIHMISRQ